MGIPQKQSVTRIMFIAAYMILGAVIGVTVFLIAAWQEAVRISDGRKK